MRIDVVQKVPFQREVNGFLSDFFRVAIASSRLWSPNDEFVKTYIHLGTVQKGCSPLKAQKKKKKTMRLMSGFGWFWYLSLLLFSPVFSGVLPCFWTNNAGHPIIAYPRMVKNSRPAPMKQSNLERTTNTAMVVVLPLRSKGGFLWVPAGLGPSRDLLSTA